MARTASLFLLRFATRSGLPDGLQAREPPQLLPRGRGRLFVVSELRGDLEARSVFGLVFPKEASGMDIAALYLFEEPFRDLSSGIDRRGT